MAVSSEEPSGLCPDASGPETCGCSCQQPTAPPQPALTCACTTQVSAHSSEHSSESLASCELEILRLQEESESVSLQVREEGARVLRVPGCTSVEASGGFCVTCKVITGWLCLCGAGTSRKGAGGSAVQRVYLLPRPSVPFLFFLPSPHTLHIHPSLPLRLTLQSTPSLPLPPPCLTPQSTPSPLPHSQLCLTCPTQSS